MSKLPKVTGRDMRGVMAYPPTPALPGAERVDAVDTVDLAETAQSIDEDFPIFIGTTTLTTRDTVSRMKFLADLGVMIRKAVESQGFAERVVVVGTGGLSHWVGLPESGQINQEFDREFLRRLEVGDRGPLTSYTRQEIDAAGNGAHEIRTWLAAAGAAGTGFDVLAYEPVPEWLTGTAVAAARL